MDILSLLRKLKSHIGLPDLIYNDTRRLLFNQKKYFLEQAVLHSAESGINGEKYCSHDIVVSLTTYGRRVHDVYLTIESLMEQTLKANRILLFLDNGFRSTPLPITLKKLEERGLEIHFCKDIRSYTKLIPALMMCPDDAIVTVDDDMLYEIDMLEKLVNAYLEDPGYVYCNRQHRMVLNKNDELQPYNRWWWNCPETDANILNFPTGVGGVLYPPHSFDEEVFNENVYMDICRFADDVWFKAMTMKKGMLSRKVVTRDPRGEEFLVNDAVQDMGLFHLNIRGKNLNDPQIKAVFDKYDLYALLK